jgi:hypothetical protein
MSGEIKHNLRRTAQLAFRGGSFIYRKPGASWLLIRMAGWVGLLTMLIRIWPLPRVLKFIQPRRRVSRRPDIEATATQEALAHLLDMLLHTEFLCFTPTCWKRALILQRYLALRGIESRVNFGMRKELDGTMSGHAWLERLGQPILETSIPNYKVTLSFPSKL